MISFFSYASADNLRLARSKVIASPDDGTYGLIHIPRFAFLLNAWCRIMTAYSSSSSGTINIGLSGNGVADDNDAIFTSTALDPEAVGWSNMTDSGGAAKGGYWFDAGSGAVTATFSIGDSSANCTIMVFALYSVLT